MIDIVSGEMSKDKDWAQVWSDSDLCKQQRDELENLKKSGSEVDHHRDDDGDEYASSTITQLKLVTKRASIQLWRDTEYVVNKVGPISCRVEFGGSWELTIRSCSILDRLCLMDSRSG